MKLAVVLSLSTAAFAASIGSQKPILARYSYQDIGSLLKQPGVSHCAENQCKPVDDKIQNECSKIVGDFEAPENIDRELALKYSFCVCDALAYARADSPCGVCLDEGIEDTTDEIETFCKPSFENPELGNEYRD